MRGTRVWTIVLGFAAFALAMTLGIPRSSAQTVELTYSNFFPPTHVQSKLAEAWCREVEKRTEGRVKITYFPGQTLTKAAQCYDGVLHGLSDIGLSCPSYTRGRFPLMAAVDLPLGYPSGVAATRVANAVYVKFQPEEFADTEVMYFHAHGPGLLHTRKKAVTALKDIKGLKIRSTGTSAQVVTALGGTPVATPMPETYSSLQKGVVDGSMYPLEANKGWKLAEVADYGVANFSSAYTTTFFVVMNKQKWNALADDVKATIGDINREWSAKHGEAWDESDIEGIRFFLNQGGTLLGQSPKEAALWSAAVESVITDYIAEMEPKGFDPKAVVDYAQEILKEVSKE